MELDQSKNIYILGMFDERSLVAQSVDNPNSPLTNDAVRFVNSRSGAGISLTDNGHTIIGTGGLVSSTLKPYGHGINENAIRDIAQNHQRIIGTNSPFYLTREHFGMFQGIDTADKATRVTEDDAHMSYRRFVQQTKGVDNWVSTGEGSFSPFLGPNNNLDTVSKTKEALFTKIVNYEDKRLTIEAGEPGDEFVQVRVDDVTINERSVPTEPGATPAVLGNRFKLTISDEGELDLRTAGKGVPGTNTHGVNIKIDAEGNLTINASGTIELSHGDADNTINSIKMDPEKGIDVRAVNGFRVNDSEVVLSPFIDWMSQNQAQLTLVTSIGGPSPIHPLALPDFVKGVQLDGLLNGFTSKGTGSPASGVITDTDDFSSI
jgi:hypothetical protein